MDRMVRGSSSLLGRIGKAPHMRGFFVVIEAQIRPSGGLGHVSSRTKRGSRRYEALDAPRPSYGYGRTRFAAEFAIEI